MFELKHQENKIDYGLIFILLLIFLVSLIAIYSGSGQYQVQDPFYFVKRQVIWYGIGIIVLIGVVAFDFELLENFAKPLFILGIVLLILVHFLGTEKNSSQRWLSFGFFDLQPSELMKIFLIIFIASLLKKYKGKKLSFKESIPITVKILFYTFIPFGLILIQPDLGSALIILSITITLIFVAGISYKLLLLLFGLFAALISCLVYLHNSYFEIFSKIIKPHQLERIYGWLYPDEYASSYGYQLKQAILGIGSGQISGAGFTEGIQVQSGNIPEVHTDFIFTVIGEEFGFIGASLLIILYFLLIYRLRVISLNTNNLFGIYLISGVIGLYAFQIFQNISMTIGLMPITGIALPFVSYGGSSLITNIIALGLVLNVNIRTKKYMFYSDDTYED